jgi:hypothetical protein
MGGRERTATSIDAETPAAARLVVRAPPDAVLTSPAVALAWVCPAARGTLTRSVTAASGGDAASVTGAPAAASEAASEPVGLTAEVVIAAETPETELAAAPLILAVNATASGGAAACSAARAFRWPAAPPTVPRLSVAGLTPREAARPERKAARTASVKVEAVRPDMDMAAIRWARRASIVAQKWRELWDYGESGQAGARRSSL